VSEDRKRRRRRKGVYWKPIHTCYALMDIPQEISFVVSLYFYITCHGYPEL